MDGETPKQAWSTSWTCCNQSFCLRRLKNDTYFYFSRRLRSFKGQFELLQPSAISNKVLDESIMRPQLWKKARNRRDPLIRQNAVFRRMVKSGRPLPKTKTTAEISLLFLFMYIRNYNGRSIMLQIARKRKKSGKLSRPQIGHESAELRKRPRSSAKTDMTTQQTTYLCF